MHTPNPSHRIVHLPFLLLALLAFAFPVFAAPKSTWAYSPGRPTPDVQLNGRQLVADRTGGVVALYEDNATRRLTVVWLNKFGQVLYKKEDILQAEILSAERNAIYIRGIFDAAVPDPTVLVVSRHGNETDVDSIDNIGNLYFDFTTPSPSHVSKPTDSLGFFAFAAVEDSDHPGTPLLLKIVRYYVR
jgi:hypothetical protein